MSAISAILAAVTIPYSQFSSPEIGTFLRAPEYIPRSLAADDIAWGVRGCHAATHRLNTNALANVWSLAEGLWERAIIPPLQFHQDTSVYFGDADVEFVTNVVMRSGINQWGQTNYWYETDGRSPWYGHVLGFDRAGQKFNQNTWALIDRLPAVSLYGDFFGLGLRNGQSWLAYQPRRMPDSLRIGLSWYEIICNIANALKSASSSSLGDVSSFVLYNYSGPVLSKVAPPLPPEWTLDLMDSNNLTSNSADVVRWASAWPRYRDLKDAYLWFGASPIIFPRAHFRQYVTDALLFDCPMSYYINRLYTYLLRWPYVAGAGADAVGPEGVFWTGPSSNELHTISSIVGEWLGADGLSRFGALNSYLGGGGTSTTIRISANLPGALGFVESLMESTYCQFKPWFHYDMKISRLEEGWNRDGEIALSALIARARSESSSAEGDDSALERDIPLSLDLFRWTSQSNMYSHTVTNIVPFGSSYQAESTDTIVAGGWPVENSLNLRAAGLNTWMTMFYPADRIFSWAADAGWHEDVDGYPLTLRVSYQPGLLDWTYTYSIDLDTPGPDLHRDGVGGFSADMFGDVNAKASLEIRRRATVAIPLRGSVQYWPESDQRSLYHTLCAAQRQSWLKNIDLWDFAYVNVFRGYYNPEGDEEVITHGDRGGLSRLSTSQFWRLNPDGIGGYSTNITASTQQMRQTQRTSLGEDVVAWSNAVNSAGEDIIAFFESGFALRDAETGNDVSGLWHTPAVHLLGANVEAPLYSQTNFTARLSFQCLLTNNTFIAYGPNAVYELEQDGTLTPVGSGSVPHFSVRVDFGGSASIDHADGQNALFMEGRTSFMQKTDWRFRNMCPGN